MESSIIVKLDVQADADNWYSACNTKSHGTDWGKRIDAETRVKIEGETKEEAFLFLIPFLQQKYEKDNLEKVRENIQRFFDKEGSELFKRMMKLTKRPISKEKITLFITTFPNRCPFYFEKGYIWIQAIEDTRRLAKTFSHELLHFQYFAYYMEKVEKEVGHEKSEWFREAMTPILNDYFGDMTENSEHTYSIYEDLWVKLSRIWKVNQDFDEFIDQSIVLLKHYELNKFSL